MKNKSEWVIDHKRFGKRRIWEDEDGYYFIVNNIVYRSVHEGTEEFEVYKSILVDTKEG